MTKTKELSRHLMDYCNNEKNPEIDTIKHITKMILESIGG